MGIRVDGLDTLVANIPAGSLGATSGKLRFNHIPRHDAADAVKFGNSSAYIADFYGDASNYIRIYWNAANTITLAFNDGGGEHTGTWDATGAIAADTTYLFEIEYSGSQMVLSVDGVAKITISQPVSFGTVPATAYLGSKQDGTLQTDGVALNP